MKTFDKRILTALLALLLCTLCACGKPAAPTDAEDAPAAEETEVPPQSAEDLQRFVGRSIGELTAVCGEPVESEYAPSCLGSGEDGTHSFKDFVVYTYKENGVETIRIIRPLP